jgi:hypothetical protein
MPVQSQPALSWVALVLAVAIGLSGCGGSSAAKAGSSARTRKAKPAPAYRVGQYCLPSKQARYRVAGMACRKHHLVKQ